MDETWSNALRMEMRLKVLRILFESNGEEVNTRLHNLYFVQILKLCNEVFHNLYFVQILK